MHRDSSSRPNFFHIKQWEFNVVVIASICAGAVGMAAAAVGVAHYFPAKAGAAVGFAIGFLLLELILLPLDNIKARASGQELAFLRSISWTTSGAVLSGFIFYFLSR